MTQSLQSNDQYMEWIAAPAAAVYFQSADCGVCHVLRPRLEALFAHQFPDLPLALLDASTQPEAAAQAGVFAFPTLLVFFEGREFLRKSRSFSPAEVAQALARPYQLWSGGR